MKPGDPVIVESATPNKRWPGQPPDTRPGVLIKADVWEGDEQWTYVHLDDGTKIAVEPWRVKIDPEHRADPVPRNPDFPDGPIDCAVCGKPVRTVDGGKYPIHAMVV